MRPSTEAEVPVFGSQDGISEKKTVSDNAYLINHVSDGGYYRIDSPDNDLFSWQVYNASGNMVLKGETKKTAIVDASMIQRGLYILKVNGKAGRCCEKIWRQ